MKRIRLLVLTLPIAAACGQYQARTGWQAIRGPDGSTWYVEHCRGDVTNCYVEIGEACQYGYTVAKESERDTGAFTTYGRGWGATTVGHRGTVIFQCKAAPGAAQLASPISDASTGAGE